MAAIVLHRPLISIFTDNEEIIVLSTSAFAVDILAEHGRAVSHVYEYALCSVGDIWSTLIAVILSCQVLRIALSYLLAIKFGLGLLGCFIGIALEDAAQKRRNFPHYTEASIKLAAMQGILVII